MLDVDDKKRLYIDVTGIRDYFSSQSRVSGIQRVVVLMINEAIKALGSDRVSLFYYDPRQRKHLARKCDDNLSDAFNPEDIHSIRANIGLRQALPSLERYHHRPLKYLLLRFEADLNACAGHDWYFKQFGTSTQEWHDAKLVQKTYRPGRFQPMKRGFESNSIVFLPDFQAASAERFQSLKAMAGTGSHLAAIFYDAIPALFPDVTPSKAHEIFFENLSDRVDHFMAISQSAADDLKKIALPLGVAGQITSVPLARERVVTTPDTTVAKGRAGIKGPYILCVGTMEIRKNNLMLARAWEALSTELEDAPTLVFAGRRGWANEEFFKFLDQSNNAGGKIEIVEAPSDAELDHLYRNCLFTAFVSLYEGWGLPIGESIAYGKTGVASNTSSMPEVAEDLMLYADPHDLLSIVDALKRLLTEPGLRESLEAKIATRKLRTWEDVARDMLAVAYGVDRSADGQAETRKVAASA